LNLKGVSEALAAFEASVLHALLMIQEDDAGINRTRREICCRHKFIGACVLLVFVL
jgi:hypothetical protein